MSQRLPLSTSSDSARYYYYEGWRQVLDLGHFSRSEEAYREMYRLDPDFLVGASLLARITPDPAERQELFELIKEKQSEVGGDEAQLLTLFTDLTQLYIYRESNQTAYIEQHRQQTMQLGEEVLGMLSNKYPGDHYYRCEYIEFVHANKGPEIALDQLNLLFPEPPPFMLGYTAQLNAEMGKDKEAHVSAAKLSEVLNADEAPYLHMVYAKIYLENGQFDKAQESVDKALSIDPRHILAKRLQRQLSAQND